MHTYFVYTHNLLLLPGNGTLNTKRSGFTHLVTENAILRVRVRVAHRFQLLSVVGCLFFGRNLRPALQLQ